MNKCPVCGKDVLRKSSKVIYCNDSCKYKAYALRNPERVKESQKRYNTNNYQKRLETWKKYRIKTGRSKTIWTEDRINTCMECNIKFKPDKFHPYMKFHSLACEAKYKSRKWK